MSVATGGFVASVAGLAVVASTSLPKKSPWNRLPNAFRSAGGNYSGGYFRLLAKQFHGPVRLSKD